MPKLTNTTALPLATTHTDDALVYIVDDSGGTPTSKSIQAQKLMAGRRYGIVTAGDNSTNQTVVADTWTKLDRFATATAALQNGVTAVAAGGGSHYLRPLSTGYWRCSYNASIASAGSAATIQTRLYMDSSGDDTSRSAHKLSSNYTGDFSATAIIDITSVAGTAGDISLWVKSTHTTVILSDGQLLMEWIAVT